MEIISNAILNATLNEKLHATSDATFEESIDYYESSRQQFETWQLAYWGTLASVTSLAIVAANVIVIVAFVVKRAVREAVNYYMVSPGIWRHYHWTGAFTFYCNINFE
jgi:hypothetical protein